MLLLARALRERGHKQRILSPADSALTRKASQDGFDVAALRGVLSLRPELRDFQIVHSHSGHAQTLSFLATARLPVVRITTRHVAFEPRHPTVHRLKYSSTCDGIIAVSEAVRDVLLSAGVPSNKIEVIPTSVEQPEAFATPEERATARERLGLAEEDFVVGHLGAFTLEKGQDVAIAAAALLQARMPQLRVILAGENPPAAPSDPRIRLPGFIDNRHEFFAALDLFVMPSRSEGWGLAAAEAMAHGIPVVASATGGLREIVEHGKSGWLVTPGDSTALADAIERAASDPSKLREIGARARERSLCFSSARTAELTETFYRRVFVPSLFVPS